MADKGEEGAGESLVEQIVEKLHGHGSASDSEGEKAEAASSSSSSVKAKVWRLFGREEPVHKVFGGGKREGSLRGGSIYILVEDFCFLISPCCCSQNLPLGAFVRA